MADEELVPPPGAHPAWDPSKGTAPRVRRPRVANDPGDPLRTAVGEVLVTENARLLVKLYQQSMANGWDRVERLQAQVTRLKKALATDRERLHTVERERDRLRAQLAPTP